MDLSSKVTGLSKAQLHPFLNDGGATHGPDDFAKVVTHAFRVHASDNCDLDDWVTGDDVPELIRVAFNASLTTDEGRYSRCSLIWFSSKQSQYETCNFDPPYVLNVANVRKLAPTAQTVGTFLRIEKLDGRLHIVGAAATRFEGLDVHIGFPGFMRVRTPPCVSVSLIGPGHIRVDGFNREFELRAGEIRQCRSLYSFSSVSTLTAEFSKHVGERVIADLRLDETQSKWFGDVKRCMDSDTLLQMILRPILNRAHGGAIVIVQDGSADWLKSAFKHGSCVTSLSLVDRAFEHLVEHVKASVEYVGGRRFSGRELAKLNNEFLTTRGRMAIAARTIGELASVDGCVVLNRELSVISFGTKIVVSKQQADDSALMFRDADSRKEIPLCDLEAMGGTRLGSALYLCKTHPNVLIFVISQDQNLKVIWSDDESAYAIGPVSISTLPGFV